MRLKWSSALRVLNIFTTIMYVYITIKNKIDLVIYEIMFDATAKHAEGTS